MKVTKTYCDICGEQLPDPRRRDVVPASRELKVTMIYNDLVYRSGGPVQEMEFCQEHQKAIYDFIIDLTRKCKESEE